MGTSTVKNTTQHHPDNISRWLAAEASGDDTGAEMLLASLVTALPAPKPSHDFADRVLARLGRHRAAARRERRAIRIAISASTLSLGTWLIAVILGQLHVGDIVTGLGRTMAGFAQVAVLAAEAWTRVDRLARLIHAVAATEQVLLSSLALVSLSVLAFASLSHLLERTRHAQA